MTTGERRAAETWLDRLWRARDGSTAHDRWAVREHRHRIGFWWALCAIGAVAAVSPLYQMAGRQQWALWIATSWQLVFGMAWLVVLAVAVRARPFDLGLTGVPAAHDGEPVPLDKSGRSVPFTMVASLLLGTVYLAVIGVMLLIGIDPARYAPVNLTWMAMWGMVIVAPIGEELIFRGIVYTAFRRDYGPGLGAVLSAVVFMLVHPMVGGWQGAVHLNHLFGGFVFAFAYERTGVLWPGILLHFLGNGSLVVLSLLRSDALPAAAFFG